jgi:hypothetical protein
MKACTLLSVLIGGLAMLSLSSCDMFKNEYAGVGSDYNRSDSGNSNISSPSTSSASKTMDEDKKKSER